MRILAIICLSAMLFGCAARSKPQVEDMVIGDEKAVVGSETK